MNTNGSKLTDAFQALEQAVSAVPLAELPLVLGHLERLRAQTWGRMLAAPSNGLGEGDLFTVGDVAARLQISKDLVYDLVRRGKITKTIIGEDLVRIAPHDLATYLAAQRG